MNPSQKYRLLMQQPGFVSDPAQLQSMSLLDDLFIRIVETKPPSWIRRLTSRQGRYQTTEGLYLWGGVGRGKTLMMDLFYKALADKTACERTHFHRFMNRIHAALRQQRKAANPLRQVAQDIARQTRVLCLDEFVIIDIGDAMIMAGLLQGLFADGVVLVTTSNVPPSRLYHDGLQRARFLPAIDLITTHCLIENLDGEQDYRRRFLQQTDLYRVPHGDAADSLICNYLDQHVRPVQSEQGELNINGRILAPRYCAEDTVWFDFTELCETSRSQNDYLELARLFSTVILTDIRQMERVDDDVARRFVLLVDVFYDHQVKLICSAAVKPEKLYLGARLKFEFERTASRLLEMQSAAYLGQAHSQQ